MAGPSPRNSSRRLETYNQQNNTGQWLNNRSLRYHNIGDETRFDDIDQSYRKMGYRREDNQPEDIDTADAIASLGLKYIDPFQSNPAMHSSAYRSDMPLQELSTFKTRSSITSDAEDFVTDRITRRLLSSTPPAAVPPSERDRGPPSSPTGSGLRQNRNQDYIQVR